jgi:hypothetical protein
MWPDSADFLVTISIPHETKFIVLWDLVFGKNLSSAKREKHGQRRVKQYLQPTDAGRGLILATNSQ